MNFDNSKIIDEKNETSAVNELCLLSQHFVLQLFLKLAKH